MRALKHSHYLSGLALLLALLTGDDCMSATFLESPDGRIRLDIRVVETGKHSRIAYKVSFEDRPVVAASTISFVRSDGAVIGDHLTVTSVDRPITHREIWKPVYGERSTITDHFHQIAINLHDASADCQMQLDFRCYNAGIAFRTVLGDGKIGQSILIEKEHSEFCFLDDHVGWHARTAQGKYEEKRIREMHGQVERPLVMRIDDRTYVAIAEAKLVDYARMKLQRSKDKRHGLVSMLSSSVQSPLPLMTPWRVIMIGETPGELLEYNDIILNLNDPCAIADRSWIKPGKVIRDITLTNKGAKACIDFATKYNLQYVEFDAGWYGHEYDDRSDATTIKLGPKGSNGSFDLHYLIDYAKKRDIGVILYVNRRALERQLDEILPLYKKWGVAGVKYGFVKVGSQEWTSWLHEAVRKAAEHELMVDVHDEYRPTGYSRTYPNLMTQEGVRGDEAVPSAEQAITTLFTRNLAGASDHTVCYFDDRVDEGWSHAHQLAKGVCSYSPWQFLFWYDMPLPQRRGLDGDNAIKETPELEFFRQLPTVWDDTKVLHGQIGQYAVIARRSGDDWFIGAMNGKIPRKLNLPLSFLQRNQPYVAHIYTDDPSVSGATQVKVTQMQVDADANLSVGMRGNGGQAIWFTPVTSSTVTKPLKQP